MLYQPLLLQVRAVAAVALSAYTATAPTTAAGFVSGNITRVLTANANGALTIDSYTTVVGDVILLAAGASAVDNGLYVVTATGSGTAPFVLTSYFQNYAQGCVYAGMLVSVDNVGTTWGAAQNQTPWALIGANGPIVVGTTSVNWYPMQQTGTQALSGGTATVSNIWVKSTMSGLSLVDQTAANAVKGVLTAGAGSGSLALTGTSTDSILWSVSNF